MDLEREKVDKVLELHFPKFLYIYSEVSLVLSELHRRAFSIVQNKHNNETTSYEYDNDVEILLSTIRTLSELYEKYINDWIKGEFQNDNEVKSQVLSEISHI